MATYLLVHGAWHGGWCWREVRAGLELLGHKTYAPTLTGLGERAHLLSADITLDTHIGDVAKIIEDEQLEEVVLVGHSYAGALLPGVAERLPDQISRLVFLDAAILKDGESLFSLVDPAIVEDRRREARRLHDGLAIPVPSGEALGIRDAALWAEVAPRLTPHPIATYDSPARLSGMPGAGLACDYIRCVEPEYAPLAWARERARHYGWPMHDLPSGHDAMLIAPADLVSLLDQVGGDGAHSRP